MPNQITQIQKDKECRFPSCVEIGIIINDKKDDLKVVAGQLGTVRGPGRSEVEERWEGWGEDESNQSTCMGMLQQNH